MDGCLLEMMTAAGRTDFGNDSRIDPSRGRRFLLVLGGGGDFFILLLSHPALAAGRRPCI